MVTINIFNPWEVIFFFSLFLLMGSFVLGKIKNRWSHEWISCAPLVIVCQKLFVIPSLPTDCYWQEKSCSVYPLIIYRKKFLHFDWLRAVQFFSKTVQKRVNSVQKEETNQAFWLVNDQRNLQMANQIFCFQIKRMLWMAQFFPDCMICVRFFCFTISKFFLVYY